MHHEVTLECSVEHIKSVLMTLRQVPAFFFDELIDLCAVDYLTFGVYDWETEVATERGFSRGVEAQESRAYVMDKPRFAVVYHLLSTVLNHRIRVKVFLDEEQLAIPSAFDIWKAANWFEREAYDLYGILLKAIPIYGEF